MYKCSQKSSMVIPALMFLVMPSLLPTTSAGLDCRKHVFAPQCRGIIAKRGGWARRSLSLPADYDAPEPLPSLAQLLERAGDAEDDALYKTYEDATYEETSVPRNAGEAGEEAEQGEGGELWLYPRGQLMRLQRRLPNGFPAEERRGRHGLHLVQTRSPGGQFRKAGGRSAAMAPKK